MRSATAMFFRQCRLALYSAALRFLVSSFPLVWDENSKNAAIKALNDRSGSGRV